MEPFNKISKVCIILSLLMPFLSLIIGRYLNNDFELFFNALILYLLVPCTMCGAWMWFSHNAGRYVNGFDNISIEKRNRFANYFGIYLIMNSRINVLSRIRSKPLPNPRFHPVALAFSCFSHSFCSNSLILCNWSGGCRYNLCRQSPILKTIRWPRPIDL